jgi:type I restriction enzyme R subunit
LFIELRTPDVRGPVHLLCENGGPEQKVIIFCTRDIHADRVAQHMNNLYALVQGRTAGAQGPLRLQVHGRANNGADMIEPMRGSGERAFIACTVDLLEAGVDIERLNAVVFFRYLQSPSSSTRWSGAAPASTKKPRSTSSGCTTTPMSPILFGTDFITNPPGPGGGGGGGGGGEGGGDEGYEATPWPNQACRWRSRQHHGRAASS